MVLHTESSFKIELRETPLKHITLVLNGSLSDKTYKKSIDLILKFCGDHSVNKLISDQRNLFDLNPVAKEYGNSAFRQHILKNGLFFHAFLINPDVFGRVSLNGFAEGEYEVTQFFSEYDHALTWLQSLEIED